jgi:hypothetical protein
MRGPANQPQRQQLTRVHRSVPAHLNRPVCGCGPTSLMPGISVGRVHTLRVLWTEPSHGPSHPIDRAIPWTKPSHGPSHPMDRAIPWTEPSHGPSHPMDRAIPWTGPSHGPSPHGPSVYNGTPPPPPPPICRFGAYHTPPPTHLPLAVFRECVQTTKTQNPRICIDGCTAGIA